MFSSDAGSLPIIDKAAILFYREVAFELGFREPSALRVVIRAMGFIINAETLAEIDEAAAAAGFHVVMAKGYEEKLVRRLQQQDEQAFNELVRLYQGRIFRLVFRMIGDRAEAEDLAQEVFVTVFKSIKNFRGDSKLSTWMYRVATNHCKNRIKYLGRRARGKKKELDELADAAAIESATMNTSAQVPRPDEALSGRQIERFVQVALASLPDEQRSLVVLRDVENLTYDEIQSVTGLAQGTVKSRLHRARLALATKVRELQTMERES